MKILFILILCFYINVEYKMNPYLIYKKNRVIIKINICQITHEKDGMRIISSGTFVLYYRIKGVSYKLIKIENRGI